MNSGAVFIIRLFGSPSIRDSNGEPVTGSAIQRHRVALLALLALAPRHSASRDKLMGILWPERDTEGARQLLNQAVYQLRKALGEDALHSTGDDLSLDTSMVHVDVLEFETAVERGDHSDAIERYENPFLDGFFLSDSPEFDRWSERERERLAEMYAKSLESLAASAEQRGDVESAVGLWRRRAAQDPYDSRVAVHLMQALDAAGNRAGALQHASLHQRMLRDDLDAELPADVAAFAEQLRTQAGPARGRVQASGIRDNIDHTPAEPSPPAVSTAVTPSPTPVPVADKPRRTSRVMAAALLLGAGVLLVFGLVRRANQPGAANNTSATIAVLPLSPLGSTPDDAALADGMTEELIGLLVQTNGLRVIGSTSAFAFRDRKLDLRTVRDSLGADHFLEGSLQKSDERLRVRIRLVDARDGATRWSQRYDRELRDVFAVQEDIARAVAAELGLRFSGATPVAGAQPPSDNIAAYELYLRGSDRTLLRSDSAARSGLEFFQRAIALDSNYAAAYAGLGRMYARVASAESLAARPRYYTLAEQAVRKALALNDSLAEAHATLGVLRMIAFDWEGADRHLNRSLQLDPANALTHEWLVSLNLWRERPADALRHAESAVRLDPLSPAAHAEHARALLFNRRCDDALAQLAKISAVQPPLLRAVPLAAECHAVQGNWAQAIALLRPQAERGRTLALGHLGLMLARAGRRDEALRIRTRLLELRQQGVAGSYDVGLIHAGLGEFDEAVALFEQGIEDGSFTGAPGSPVHLLLMGPLLEDLRADPRFTRIRNRLGL